MVKAWPDWSTTATGPEVPVELARTSAPRPGWTETGCLLAGLTKGESADVVARWVTAGLPSTVSSTAQGVPVARLGIAVGQSAGTKSSVSLGCMRARSSLETVTGLPSPSGATAW